MDLTEVREGLAARLNNVSGLRVFSYVPDSASPPIAVVAFPESFEFDLAMNRGLDSFPIIPVLILVGRASDRASQALLATFVAASGPTSIKQAIEGDRTLGGACSDLRVTRVTDFKLYPIGATEYLGCRFEVQVIG